MTMQSVAGIPAVAQDRPDQRAAAAAASAAGVTIIEAGRRGRLGEVAALLGEVWQSEPGREPFTPDLLRVIAHGAGSILIAEDSQEVVGAAVAIFCSPASRRAYSLIAAARTSDRGVGYALKLAQRDWAMREGATSIMWTFDPLLRRNARFNLVKLRAVAEEYLVDFHGRLDDGINGSDETDRLTAVWCLTGTRQPARPAYLAAAQPCGEVERLGPDGEPLLRRDGAVLWCRIPEDIVALRHQEPALAAAWRVAVREAFTTAFADGLVATAITRDGWYRLEAK
jgi:predicted GNAT superfamily acetyltransferase